MAQNQSSPLPNSKAKRHPVNFVAGELGVERGALTRRLKQAGVDYLKGVTFAEAFSAWMQKAKRESNRDRRDEAEADSAEMDAAQKKGLLILKKDAQLLWADLTIETRKLIQAQPKWESGQLLVKLSKVKIENKK